MATASQSNLHPEDSNSDSSGSDSDASSPSMVMDDFKCLVCLDYYDDPKLLPCGHLACCKCLLKWLQANAMPRTCPGCRAPITEEEMCRLPATMTPEEICEALPTELSMVWLVRASRKLQGPHVCEKCQQEATSLCLTCCLKLCRECRRKHAKAVNKRVAKAQARRQAAVKKAGQADLGLDENHPNIPYVALKPHRIKPLRDLTALKVCRNRGDRCTVHQFEENWNVYYCDTHKKFLCMECVREDHGRCAVVTAKAKVKKQRKILAEQQDQLDQHDERLRKEIERLGQRGAEAERRSEILQAQLDGLQDKLVEDLHVARDRLKEDLLQAQDLPALDRARHQASVLQAFNARIEDLVSLKEAENLVSRFEDYSREVVQEVRGRQAALGCQSHHRHHQSPRQGMDLSTEFRAITSNLSTEVRETVDDMELLILPFETSATDNDTPDNSDTNAASTARRHISDID